ncbi:hypothetical protein ACF09H_22115 [Streptomyces sp. NPDC014983]|uniref:hypothetical protein n=1 Tax=Streptomyces sp. NPDC014983 TaxID=3364933 RepID=UPI0036FC31EE
MGLPDASQHLIRRRPSFSRPPRRTHLYTLEEVPSDWKPEHRCCLECGNSEPLVSLLAVTNVNTNKQALTCRRHVEWVAAALG